MEMIRNGTTCYLEAGTVLTPEMAARAARTVGIRAVITDPKVYTRPWTFSIYFNRAMDYGSELYEEACVEVNDRNMELLTRPGRN